MKEENMGEYPHMECLVLSLIETLMFHFLFIACFLSGIPNADNPLGSVKRPHKPGGKK
ncbi:MAG: hypothetical protein ACYCO5_10270 [Acidobacteriaceae bacterium]